MSGASISDWLSGSRGHDIGRLSCKSKSMAQLHTDELAGQR